MYLRMKVPLVAVAALLIVAACGAPAATPPTATTKPAGATPRSIASPTPVPQGTTGATNNFGFKTPEELIPPGLAEAYPLIAKYHWSRLPRPSQAKPKSGGTLRLPMTLEPNNWDPFTGNTGTSVWGTMIYSHLVISNMRLSDALRGKGNLRQNIVECEVCESWTTPSPTQYVFKIRKDVVWQNVAPLNARKMTAADIKYAYDKYLDPKALRQYGIFKPVQSIEAPDDTTLVINMKYPSAGFLDATAYPVFYIFPKEGYEREGGLKPDPPLGSGSMTLDQHQVGTNMTLKRNTNYWKKDEYGQTLPYLDAISMVFMPAVATINAAFRTGQLDTIYQNADWNLALDLLRTEKIGVTANLKVQEGNYAGNSIVGMQLRRAPFNDVRVRRALNMALDRPAIIKRAFGDGYCSPGPIPGWWQSIEYPPACKDMPQYQQYNPAKAKELLKEAGYDEKNPLSFEWFAGGPGGAVLPSILSKMETEQEMYKAVGVIVTIKQLESTVAQQRSRLATTDGMGMAGQGSSTDLDGYAQAYRSDGPENYAGINDPEMDKLVDAQRGEFDLVKRKALAKQISDRLYDQAYFIFDAGTYFVDWTRPYMQNYVSNDHYYWIHGFGAYAMENTWFDK